MAYRNHYNPDALTVNHAEPDEAAAKLSRTDRDRDRDRERERERERDRDRLERLERDRERLERERADRERRDRERERDRREYGKPPPPLPGRSGNNYPNSPAPPGSYGYGYGTGPVNLSSKPQDHGRPPNPGYRPATAPPRDGNDRDALWPMFRSVDKDGSGQLTERELRTALVNGDFSAFDPHTVRMMIRMFDADRNGSISFDEFCGLWGFLEAWRRLFDRFDTDRSGNISLSEFKEALVAFGYRLSPSFIQILFKTYDRRNEGAMSFDLFVQACISLKRMTDVFKRYDEDRDGYITLSFEEFLTEIIRQLD